MSGIDKYTKLLLHMNDDNFKDECEHEVVNNGVTINTSNKKFGNGSAYFDGSSYLSLSDNDDWNFGNKDFTIDFWIKFSSIPTNSWVTLYSQRNSGTSNHSLSIFYNTVTTNKFFIAYTTNGTTEQSFTYEYTPTLNTWIHFSLERYNNNFNLYINGINVKTISFSGTLFNSSENVYIGVVKQNTLESYFDGYIDEFRVSKGIARWKGDFNIPSKPYSKYKYLIQDKNSIIYTFNGTDIVQIPLQTLDEDNFKNNGVDDITAITEEQWNKIFPNKEDIKILMWTDDIEKQEAKLTYECEPFELTDWLKKDECKLLVYTDDLEKKDCEMIYNCEPYKPIDKLKETGNACKVLIKEV